MLKQTALFLITLCLCGTAQATLILSTTSTATLSGTSFRSDAVVSYENGILSPLFSGNSAFDNRENIDAFSWLDDTRFVFSTSTDGAIGGFTFNDGDLIQWDTTHNTASLFLSESIFSDNEDIDALHILESGEIAFSTTSDASVGGMTFKSGDIVIYDPLAESTRFLFEGKPVFDKTENIDALSILDDQWLVFSTSTDASIDATTYLDGDLILFDLSFSEASLYFSEANFNADEDINALAVTGHINEPGTLGLFLIAFSILFYYQGIRPGTPSPV